MRFASAFLILLMAFDFTYAKAPTSAPPTPESKPEWVREWKEIKILSTRNRMKACDRLEKLSWASAFPFPNIIQEKKEDYCRQPPPVTHDFYGLMKLAQFYRHDFNLKSAQKYLSRAARKAKTKRQKISYWKEQQRLDHSQQNKQKRLRAALKLKNLDPDKYLVDYARMLWTYDQRGKAISTLKRAKKIFKKSTSLQEVYFVLGRIEEEKKQPTKALYYYDLALKQPTDSTDVLTKVLAFAAWVNYSLGEYQLSDNYWQKLYEKSPEQFTKSRALYWRSVCQKALKQNDAANQSLQKIIDDDPTSYYAILAYRDLKKPLTPIKPFDEDPQAVDKMKFFDETEKELLTWLSALDEKEMAETLLLYRWDEALKAPSSQQTAYFQFFWKLGLTNALIRALYQLDDKTRLELTEKYQAALFPYHYEKEITQAAEEEKIDPYFVMALIRQESAFNPEARSPTDALGLMQVMPSLAHKIAKKKKVNFKKSSELFNPSINLKIGTRELRNRLEDFNESELLAAASYNAGLNVVKSWLKLRYKDNPVEFIEVIPYEETRSYVRLIIRNKIFYQRLFSKNSFLFPEDTLSEGWMPPKSSKKRAHR